MVWVVSAMWAGVCVVAYRVGRSIREEEVISKHRSRTRRLQRDLKRRQEALNEVEGVRVRDAKIRSTRRGYYGEEKEDET